MRSVIFLTVLLAAVPAAALVVPVVNASFETLPSGGLPNCNGVGTGCYSQTGIFGWVNSGDSGQFQPLSGSLNYIPDGATIAFSNGSAITQTVSVTAVAGRT